MRRRATCWKSVATGFGLAGGCGGMASSNVVGARLIARQWYESFGCADLGELLLSISGSLSSAAKTPTPGLSGLPPCWSGSCRSGAKGTVDGQQRRRARAPVRIDFATATEESSAAHCCRSSGKKDPPQLVNDGLRTAGSRDVMTRRRSAITCLRQRRVCAPGVPPTL